MSALDNTTRRYAALPGLRTTILASVAVGAMLTLLPSLGHAQGLDRLFNRAAETQTDTAAVEGEEAGDALPSPDDTWGLDVEVENGGSFTDVVEDPDTTEPSVLTLPTLGESPTGQTAGTIAAINAEPDPVREELERQIDARMRSITERIGETTPPQQSDTLTVEELDGLQRDAQRAAAAQTLKDAEYQAIRGEIEMLIFLQNTVTELQESRMEAAIAANPPAAAAAEGAAAAVPEVDVEALRAQWEAEQAASQATQEQEQRNAALAAEQAAIPRLAAVKGAAGTWEAEIESVRGVMQFVAPGDALADGFLLESLDGKGAVIQAAASGNRYSLIPSPPSGPAAAGEQEMPMATDLSQNGGVF